MAVLAQVVGLLDAGVEALAEEDESAAEPEAEEEGEDQVSVHVGRNRVAGTGLADHFRVAHLRFLGEARLLQLLLHEAVDALGRPALALQLGELHRLGGDRLKGRPALGELVVESAHPRLHAAHLNAPLRERPPLLSHIANAALPALLGAPRPGRGERAVDVAPGE